MLWKNTERMSLWMDEYRSVPISGWPNRKDCPSDDGSAKVSWSTKPSTFENSPVCMQIYNNLRHSKKKKQKKTPLFLKKKSRIGQSIRKGCHIKKINKQF